MRTLTLSALLLLALTLPVCSTYAADPPPVVPVVPVPVVNRIIGPGEQVDQTDPIGSEENPFIFEQGDKGKLILETKATKVLWKLTKAPSDTELLMDGKLLWFSTKQPNLHQFIVSCSGPDPDSLDIIVAWARIKGSGPSPPIDDQAEADRVLSKRVQTGFNGQPAAVLATDARKFQAALSALQSSMRVKPPNKLSNLATDLKTALDAVQWEPNKYPDLSRLAGELAGGSLGGPGVADKTLDGAYVTEAIRVLDVVTKACQNVSTTQDKLSKSPPPPK